MNTHDRRIRNDDNDRQSQPIYRPGTVHQAPGKHSALPSAKYDWPSPGRQKVQATSSPFSSQAVEEVSRILLVFLVCCGSSSAQ